VAAGRPTWPRAAADAANCASWQLQCRPSWLLWLLLNSTAAGRGSGVSMQKRRWRVLLSCEAAVLNRTKQFNHNVRACLQRGCILSGDHEAGSMCCACAVPHACCMGAPGWRSSCRVRCLDYFKCLFFDTALSLRNVASVNVDGTFSLLFLLGCEIHPTPSKMLPQPEHIHQLVLIIRV
jgi:hypothetical protein